jgi:RNA polymerase sigma factor (sigma-70 family)
MSDVTRVLSQIESGDPAAAGLLLPLVYDELRKLAAAKLVQEKPGQTLQATALVHEAYLRLVASGGRKPAESTCDGTQEPDVRNYATPDSQSSTPKSWNSRGHFFAAAAEAMRRILIEQARRRYADKRGGGRQRVEVIDLAAPDAGPVVDLLALDEALTRLEAEAPQKAELVKLRFFAGLSIDEAAAALGISAATAKRHWTYARAWLYGQVAGD